MSTDHRRQLGRIKSAKLHLEDHGMFQLVLNFDFGHSEQSFAPLLWTPQLDLEKKTPAELEKIYRLAAGCWDLLYQVLALFNADEVGQLKGQCAYALRDSDSWGEYIRGIERIEADGGGSFHLRTWQTKWGAER
jgi:hypothetical protein